MNELSSWFLGVGCGFAISVMVSVCFTVWGRSGYRDRAKAARVLKRQGLTPQLYLPAVGEGDTELRAALEFFAARGYIITNTQGEVVGKVCPRPEEGRQGPHLRLVVSNLKVQDD